MTGLIKYLVDRVIDYFLKIFICVCACICVKAEDYAFSYTGLIFKILRLVLIDWLFQKIEL